MEDPHHKWHQAVTEEAATLRQDHLNRNIEVNEKPALVLWIDSELHVGEEILVHYSLLR